MAHNTMPNRSPLPRLALLGALLLALLCALLYYRAAKARANDAMLEELERRAAPMP